MNGLSPITFDKSDERVPYPVYRCKATVQERPGHTHQCRSVQDHKRHSHMCICGREWEPVAA